MAPPVVLLVVVALLTPARAQRCRQPDSWALALVFIAIGVEVAALALGGRSAAVATLSTVADHLVTNHPARFVTFLVWSFVGTSRLIARA